MSIQKIKSSDLIPDITIGKKQGEAFLKMTIGMHLSFCQICIDAINTFEEGNLRAFDPPVGDSGCKARAAKLLDLEVTIQFDETKTALKKVVEKIQNLKIEPPKLQTPWSSICEKMGLNFEISKDVAFVCTSFFLAKFKRRNQKGMEEVDQSKIRQDLKITRGPAWKLINSCQKVLSELSCSFVEKEAAQINKLFLHLVTGVNKQMDHLGRSCLPCLPMLEFCLKAMLRKNQLLKIQVGDASFVFQPSKDKSQWEKANEMNLKGRACMVIIGISKDFKALEKCDVMKVLLASAAQHDQFPLPKNPHIDFEGIIDEVDGTIKSLLKEEKLRHEQLSAFAKKKGFSIENPSIFCTLHIFCDRG